MFFAGALGYRHREVSELLCDRGCSRAGPRHEQVHLAPPHRQRPGQSLQFSLVGCTTFKLDTNDPGSNPWKNAKLQQMHLVALSGKK